MSGMSLSTPAHLRKINEYLARENQGGGGNKSRHLVDESSYTS